MRKYLNADYWKKAYLLEFKTNGVLEDAFTFSVPPESEEFTFPQRKSETKTFGGAVVADYGNDLVNITLSGSTINQEVKLIYKGSLGTDEMTGEQEIFYLRDLLKKYGQRENLVDKEVYLYSLNGGKSKRKNPKWWQIYIGQLDINRSKDKPFCYNYKFTATGAPEVTKKSSYKELFADSIGKTINSWYDSVRDLTNKMNETADLIDEYGGGFLDELSGYISKLRQCINMFNGACGRYSEVLSGLIEQSSDVAYDTVMLGDRVLWSAFRYYPTITADVWNSCLDARDTYKKIYVYCSNIDETYFSKSSWQSIRELFDDSVSDQDIVDTYSSLAYSGMTSANRSVALTSKNLNDIGVAVKPGSAGEDDTLILTYGYKIVIVTDAETSWDQVAYDYYGDATLSYIVATFNNLPTDEQLHAGQKILIPNLNYAGNKSDNNEVYNSPDEKDNYGKDIFISDSDFGIYNGDLAAINGIDNLNQALLNRYSTLIGARIRVETYGIQASIGDAVNATSALIQASVHQTTVEDPRVDTVEDITFIGAGDKLTVAVIYKDKNGSRGKAGGTV